MVMGGCILGVVDPSCASGSSLRIRLSTSSFKAMRWCTCGPKGYDRPFTKHGLATTKKTMTGVMPKIKSYLDQISKPGPCVSTEIGSCQKWSHFFQQIPRLNVVLEHIGDQNVKKINGASQSSETVVRLQHFVSSDLAKRQEQAKTNV